MNADTDLTSGVKLTCNWTCDQSLMHNCLSVKFSEDHRIEFDPERLQLEKCFQILKPENENNCPMINFQCDHIIEEILILSESKRVEIFDNDCNGEYLKTVEGNVVDEEEEDMKMFAVHVQMINLKRGGIKMSGFKGDQMWIMDITLGVKKEQISQKGDVRFDINHLNSLLDQSQLSEKAQNFKKLFDQFQQSRPSGILQQSPIMNSNLSDLSPVVEMLKMALLSEIQAVEKRLSDRMEEAIKVQNDKLDTIIGLLSKRE